MRIPQSVFAIGRYALILAILAASIVLLNGDVNKNVFGVHDLAHYAAPNVIQYIQPGLTFTIVSAKIASDGTISVDYKISDPTGAALDKSGVVTPGPVSASFLAAYIPAGQAQFASYITRTATAVTGGATATQASGDSGGTTQTVAVGEYIYTFKTKAPAGFNANATNRIGIYGSRNLTQWGLGTDYADTTFDFVPSGSGTPAPRDVVRNADCNTCHGSAATATGANGLAAHGGSRKSVGLCIMCHQPQTSDPNNGNSLDMKVFIHKIHMGSSLPSVQAGKPYQIIGYQNSVNDWSTVVYPADVRRCATCHNPKNGAAQTNAWLTTPGAAACGSCHDDVNFATGANHLGGFQENDNECANCHIQKGETPFDASILGAHVVPSDTAASFPANPDPLITSVNIHITGVTNTAAGQKPVVAFTIKDTNGNPLAMSLLEDLSFTMAGPTTDYGNTSFGSDVTTQGYVTEDGTVATCDGSSNCTYTFLHAIPAKATGSYAIAVESERLETVLPNTNAQQDVESGTPNQVVYFSVDGSPVVPRRTVVATANCNQCHVNLQGHGARRNAPEYCVLCHNPLDTDISQRPNAKVASDRTLPAQSINMALMVHKIHTGVNLAQFNQTYIVVGHGGSHNDFSDVRYPAMGPTGAVQDTAQCYMCHTGGSEGVFPEGKNAVVDPQGLLNPAPATTSACTACHLNTSAFAHAVSQTDPKFGETCDVCHATGQAFDVDVVHAGK